MSTHALLVPAPLNDMRTVCNLRLHDAPAGDLISSLPEMIDCEVCRAMLGHVTARDWNEGLPEVTEVDTSGNLVVVTKAHRIATEMARTFLDALESAHAANFLEYSFQSRIRPADEQIAVTVQRVSGKTPAQKLDAALAALRLVPRGPGDHVAGCPAGIRTPQGGPPPIGQGDCSCHVDEVRRVLGEVT